MGMPSAGGSRRGRRFRPSAEINVTPLVDVMLVLLIIFMVTAPMLTSGINVDLPKSSAAPHNVDVKPVNVSVKEDGTIYLDDHPVAEQDLVAQLRERVHDDQQQRIHVRGDLRLSYGQVARIMAMIAGAGFKRIALDTREQPAGQ
ncbi:Tol-Pal system protein TolR [Acetobacteraceae bacterium EV16G]|uniref:Tol-Pal system protein TolR n=1 Tax=Sorlinia euscelidii TaxID=3081148 RepID=A0ABU7U1T2_9PROT